MKSEHRIQQEIQKAISEHNGKIFRANVGKVFTNDKRWFDTGLPRGYPDLSGFYMNSKGDVIPLFIEVKSAKGKPREDQIRFHKMLTAWGVVHGIARSKDDAIKIMDEGLVGYGY